MSNTGEQIGEQTGEQTGDQTGDRIARRVVIGIVGGIGAGKSHVAKLLGELGAVVVDSDQLARSAYQDAEVRRAVVEQLGEGVLGADGLIDRRKVASIIFSDSQKRQALEAIIHPRIESQRIAISQAAPVGTRAIVWDSPLLFESGLADRCDAIVMVDVSREERLRRVQENRGWSEAELDRREASQWPVEKKRKSATHVVENGADQEKLKRELKRLLDELENEKRPR